MPKSRDLAPQLGALLFEGLVAHSAAWASVTLSLFFKAFTLASARSPVTDFPRRRDRRPPIQQALAVFPLAGGALVCLPLHAPLNEHEADGEDQCSQRNEGDGHRRLPSGLNRDHIFHAVVVFGV